MNLLNKYTIYKTIHGSRAYGLATPTSDVDIKGVFIAPKEYYNGFVNHVEQIEEHTPNDLVIYEIKKFFHLAANCNPNIIEILHTDEAFILEITELGRELRDTAHLFISQKAKFTFAGYAHSQLQRIRGHYKWLSNPPIAPPERSSYGLPERTLIPRDHLAATEALIKQKIDSWDIDWELFDQATKIQLQNQIEKYLSEILIHVNIETVASRSLGFSDNFIHVLQQEKLFTIAQKEWIQYQDWIKNRNPVRAELEKKYGYDTKHAMHLVRLYRMGIEILSTGKVIVKRPDREELLAIRNEGIWTYEQLIEWADQQDKKLDEIYKSGASPIPKSPDRKKLDELCIDIVTRAHTKQ